MVKFLRKIVSFPFKIAGLFSFFLGLALLFIAAVFAKGFKETGENLEELSTILEKGLGESR